MSPAQSALREIPLDWPSGGLDEDLSRTEQRALTSPELVNVRTKEPSTGRLRGGTREGTTLQAGPVNSTNPVRQIQIAQFDKRGSTFSQLAQDSYVEDWVASTPLKQACAANDVDLQNNRYVLDGRAGLAKYTQSGQLVYKMVLPVDSPEHECRALVVDGDGTVYIAVSAGNPQKTAKLMKFRPDDTGQGVPNLEWSIPLQGYIERMRLRGGALFCACNFPDRGASEIRVYRLVDSSVPELAWVREQVPYPTNDLDVRATDGAILTAHESNAKRAYDLRAPDHQKIARDWDPSRLDQAQERIWCILDASNIDGLDPTFLPIGTDLNSEYQTGDPINLWTDASGQGRHAYSFEELGLVAPTGVTPPTLNKSKRFAGQDTVVFSFPTDASPSYSDPHCVLLSNSNPSSASNAISSQRTFIPTVSDAWFSAYVVLRTTNTATTTPRGIIVQNYDEAGTGNTQALVMNANTTGGGGLTGSATQAAFFNGTGGAGPYAVYDSTDGFAVLAFTAMKGSATTTGLNSVNGTAATNPTYTAQTHAGVIRSMLGRWTTTISGSTAYGSSLPFDGEIAYILVLRHYTPAGGSKTILSAAEHQKIVGFLHWRFGIVHKLDAGHTYKLQPPTADALPGTSDSPYLQLTDTEQMLVKWDPNKARTRWIVKDDSSSTGTGGIGYGCNWPNNGATDFCFSMGPKGAGTGGTATQIRTRESVVRRIKDSGDSASVTGSGTWESKWGAALEPSYHYPKCCVSGIAANSEQDGNAASDFFVPYHESTSGTQDAVYIYLTSGTAAGSNTNTPPDRTIALASGSRGYCCAVERYLPEYVPGNLNSLIDQFVFVGTEFQGSSSNTISNVRLVSESRSNTSPRGTYVAAVAGTALRKITAGVSTPIGAPTLAGLNYTSIVAAFQRLWIADGGAFYVLDPRLSDGQSKVWKSKSSGEIPRGARLLAFWRNRLIATRGLDNEIYLSQTGNPYNWDISPIRSSGREAFRLPSLGEAVNCLIPATDDLLIAGTQTRIMRMTGDPALGGDWDQLSDEQGLAFGEPWCKDPDGAIYAFGSRGDVLRGTAGGFASISEKRIRRRLQDIDLGTYFVRLAWNWRAGGLHVFLIPQGTGSGQSFGYFWEKRTNAWYRDEFPWWIYSARQVDGDEVAARAVWIGAGDGKVYRFDESSDTDAGAAIYWSVVGGPIRSRSRRQQVIVRRPRFVFADGLEGAKVALLSSGSSELPPIEQAEFELEPPLTDACPISARGGNVWWRLRGKGRFGFEEGSALVEEFGVRQAIT